MYLRFFQSTAAISCTAGAYPLGLLGLRLYEPASGVSLEHDAGDGAQTLAAFIHANMEPATDRLALGSVWCVRFPTQRS